MLNMFNKCVRVCASFTVEVLRCYCIHRLARGPEGESSSGPLLPGALPELWAELHQHVLEQSELAVILMQNILIIACPVTEARKDY